MWTVGIVAKNRHGRREKWQQYDRERAEKREPTERTENQEPRERWL